MRLFILIGTFFLFLHLHATGNISKYINMRYSYVSLMAIYILAIFIIIEFYLYLKVEKEEEKECHYGHDHSHENKGWRKYVTYILFWLPVITGIFLPVATMDSNIVAKKGFHFSVYQSKDQYGQHEFLQPDSSVYYGTDGYFTLMNKAKKKLLNQNKIVLTDNDYMNDLETIYTFPGNFTGRQVTITGFSYRSKDTEKNQVFLFRFGIIHCISDSGVFGMLIELPNNMHPKNDEWFTVTGDLQTIYYQPFKKTIPILKVSSIHKILEPDDPYVYRRP